MAVTFNAVAFSNNASFTMPTHSVGDLLIVLAYNFITNPTGGLINPGIPASGGSVPNWKILTNNAGNLNTDGTWSNSATVAYAVATSSSTTAGSWTNTSGGLIVSVSGHGSIPFGGYSEVGGQSSTNFTAPAIAMADTSGQSLLVHAVFDPNGGLTFTVPSGYTLRTATYNYGRLFTKDSSTSDGAATITKTGTNSGACYRSASLEICVEGAVKRSGFFAMF